MRHPQPGAAQPLARAGFLDCDGTLIEDRGHLASPDDVVFFPQTAPALARLASRFRLFIVTNQRGVAEGILTPAQVEAVNQHVAAVLARAGIAIARVYACPHLRSNGCACIKPNPHFLHRAAAEFALDLAGSWTVGDHPHDVELACRAGARGLYVLTGHGARHLAELPPDTVVVPGIAQAVDWILAHTPPGAPDGHRA